MLKATAPAVHLREFNTPNWKTAYQMSYESLCEGMTVDSFEHSLKNTRDSFDVHTDSNRVGWYDRNGEAAKLNTQATQIMRDFR
jgi:hypothetical protein